MMDRIFHIAAFGFRTVQHMLEKSEQRWQEQQLQTWRTEKGLNFGSKKPMRVVDISSAQRTGL